MKTITVKLYGIEELKTVNEQAHNNIIEQTRQELINLNFEMFRYDIKDNIKDLYNIDVDRVQYGLSYSQGDGFSFDTDNALQGYIYDELLKKLTDKQKEILKQIESHGLPIFEISNNRRYPYSAAADVKFADNSLQDELNDDEIYFIHSIKKYVADAYLTVCRECERLGYACYDVADAEIIDCLNVNERYFTANGTEI